MITILDTRAKPNMSNTEKECYDAYMRCDSLQYMQREFLLESKENCDKAIASLTIEKKGYDLATYNSDSIKTNPFNSTITAVKNLKEFFDYELPWSFYGNGIGFVIVEKPDCRKLIFNLSTCRWRADGKNIWYHSRTPNEFIRKYCI